MKILAINCGSSSLKFDVLQLSDADETPERLAEGEVERIGHDSWLWLQAGEQRIEDSPSIADHAQALREALRLLNQASLLDQIDAVVHRVVHGGARFSAPTLVDPDVLRGIEAATELAPLHNRPALTVLYAASEQLGHLPMVASFDTAFFIDLPDVSREYALPRDQRERLGIRRFGFHGLAHRYMVERYRALRPNAARPRLVTLQLGSGCSAAASIAGRPIDTSMGFTPLEGLIMGTRSGDIDPMLPLLLLKREGLTVDEVEELLNTRSGLLGLSGRSNDMKDLQQAAADGDRDADLAVRAFCYRVRKYAGAYMSAMGGCDAIVFGGGIGERSALVRQAVGEGLAWCGLVLESQKNQALVPVGEELISTPGSAIEVWVMHVDEATVMARDAFEVVGPSAGRGTGK